MFTRFLSSLHLKSIIGCLALSWGCTRLHFHLFLIWPLAQQTSCMRKYSANRWRQHFLLTLCSVSDSIFVPLPFQIFGTSKSTFHRSETCHTSFRLVCLRNSMIQWHTKDVWGTGAKTNKKGTCYLWWGPTRRKSWYLDSEERAFHHI